MTRRHGSTIPTEASAAGSGTGDLLAANNLSDVASATTSRTNLGVGTGDSPQFAAINLGHASDTTITRSAAGKAAVEGKAVPLMSGAFDLVFAGPGAARTWTGPDADVTLLYSGGALGTPASGTLTNATGYVADFTLAENKALILDATLSADGKYTATEKVAGTAGAALAFGDVVYLAVADSRWELADASAASTSGTVLVGICVLAAAADGDPTEVMFRGTIRADAAFPALTVGAAAYISETAGDVTNTAPTTTDSVTRVLGHGLDANTLLVNISPDFTTHV